VAAGLGSVMGTNIGVELLVGYTRLGNLLGLLDREEIVESKQHLVWVPCFIVTSGKSESRGEFTTERT
jgi:hypothetical protein